METGKFQLLTRFEFPSCASIKSKLQHPPPTNPQAVELLKIGLGKSPPPPRAAELLSLA